VARRPISDLEAHLGYWLRFVSNHVSHAFQRKLELRGVTVAEWVVLRDVYGEAGISPSEVADRLGMTRGAISKLVDRLAEKGLVEREAVAKDRRYQSIRLTSDGRALVPELAALADANDLEFFGALTAPQRKTLLDLLKKIVRAHDLKEIPTR